MSPSSTLEAPVDSPALATAVLDTLGLACAVVERVTGRVAAMTAGLETLTGLSRGDVVGRPVAETLLDPSAAAVLTHFCPQGLQSSGPVTFGASLTTAAGETVPVAWTVSAVSDGELRETHLLLLAGDGRPDPAVPALFAHVATSMTTAAALGTDRDGRVTYCNPGMEAMLGVASADLLGKPAPLSLLDPEQLRERAERAGLPVGPDVLLADPRRFDRRSRPSPDLGRLDGRGAAGDRRTPATEAPMTDWTLVRPDGTRAVASFEVRTMRDSAGRHVGYLAWAIDVTAERRTHDLLVSALDKEREAAQRLTQLDRTRNDFVATASHELRTPVTSIRGYAEMMADGQVGELSPRHAMFVEAILRNADRLSSLADDLLVLCRMDAEVEQLADEPVDLGELVLSTGDAVRSGGLSRSVELRVDVPEGPVQVRGDADALELVVTHLLTNAVKFTEAGTVACALSVEGDRAVVEVTDTGIGIPVEEQEMVFTRFFRASGAQDRAIPGSGLGLCIVETLVAAHGGDVSVSSEPGAGTRFTVTVPLLQP